MIDEDDDMNRRVRIIARTLVLNNVTRVSGAMYWNNGALDTYELCPSNARALPLVGNDLISMQQAIRQLLNAIADDLDYAASDYPASRLELRIRANGSWEIKESYQELQTGDNGYVNDGHVDLQQYDEEAA